MKGGLLVLLCLLPCLPPAATAAPAGGAGDGALRVTVTVNGRRNSGTHPPALRAGGPVVTRYRLVNRGEAHLYGLRILDPSVPGGTVRCPRRPLPALGELECVARFRAAPGAHRGTVRAEGSIPSLRRLVTATARAGYSGVAGALRLTERVTVAPPAHRTAAPGRLRALRPTGTATVTYTVTNLGNRPLHAVRVDDPALGLRAGSGTGAGAAVDCGGRPGTVPVLAPGASARCTATVRRPPGTHRSTGLASGTDRVTTYGPDGARIPAPTLVARSSAVFTLPAAAEPGASRPPSGPGRPAEPVRGSGGAPGARGGGATPSGRPAAPGSAGVPAPGAPGARGGGATPSGRPAAPGSAGVPAPGAPGARGGGATPSGRPAAPGSAGVPAPGAAVLLELLFPGAGAQDTEGAGGLGGVGDVGDVGDVGGMADVGGLGDVGNAGAGGGGGGAGGAAAGGGAGAAAAAGTGAGAAAGTGGLGSAGGRGGDVSGVSAGTSVPPPSARRAAALDDEGFVGRLRRRGREASELGVVTMLLLLLIPAAVAAALLGNRKG
ncbi:DUF11 domain-containing protein [Streptomyces venezuelae]|uniref:DUF11 domain-containing protein n=1 Tax=Streptomyces venezuelae TaxID=54571 RepID=UPI00168909D3|nr:DUF11 domain-containing protein [Streptomyces venezuelae]